MKKEIHVFDVDGTVINCSSEKLLVNHLFSNNKVSLFCYFLYYFSKLPGMLNLRSIENYCSKLSKYYLVGLSAAELDSISKELFYEEIIFTLNPIISEKIKLLHRQKKTVIFLSASLIFLLEPIGKYLNVDKIIGTKIIVDKKGYIIKPVFPYPISKFKVKFLKAYLSTKGQNSKEIIKYVYANDIEMDREILNFGDFSYLIQKNNLLEWRTIQ